METLYIIGNGFDLHHNLPTTYGHFYEYLEELHKYDLLNTFEKYFEFSTNDKYLWTNFEQDLGTFNWESFFSNIKQFDIFDEDFKPSYIYGLEDDIDQQAKELVSDIRDAFFSWIEEIETILAEKIEKNDPCLAKKILPLKSEAFFINFNYTSVLESVYQISSEKILHIHGKVNAEELIFGHNKSMNEEPELDENGETNDTMFTDSQNSAKYPFHNLKKQVDEIISMNIDTFKSFSEVKEVFVLGHSLNEIDIPYTTEILKNIGSANWTISYYCESEKETLFHAIKNAGVPVELIKMIRLNEYEKMCL